MTQRLTKTDPNKVGTDWLKADLLAMIQFEPIVGYLPGVPASNAVLLHHICTKPYNLLEDLPGSYGKSLVAASGSTTFTIKRNNVSIGTMVFAAAATSATFTFSDDISFAVGDRLTVHAPASADAAISGVAFSLQAILNGGMNGVGNFDLQFEELTDGATITWDFNGAKSKNGKVTLGGNRTLALTGIEDGCNGVLIMKQDPTGNRNLTLPASSIVVGGGGTSPILSSAADAIDILAFYYDGTDIYWVKGLGAS